MSSVTLLHEYHADNTPPLIIERFLRDRDSVWLQIKREQRLNRLIGQMLLSSAAALVGYGAVMGAGASSPFLQAFASALKLPVLYLLTLAICLPTLYLFNLLCGGRLSVRQALALSLSAITVSSALTLAFAPITIFFLITTSSYAFYQLLNVSILMLTGLVGLQFLVIGVRSLNVLDRYDPSQEGVGLAAPPAVNMTLLYLWLGLYGFVGTQLGWTLRPFFGDPSRPFLLFHSIESNFYVGVLDAFFQIFR